MLLVVLLLLATPALADAPHDGPHDGTVTPRTGPEASDVALVVMAAGGVWAARRALRARWAKRKD